MIARRTLFPLLIAFGFALAAPAAMAGAGKTQQANIDDAQQARGIVQTIADQALDILKRPSRAERHVQFQKLFVDYFNTAAIARFVLGRYRSGVSPDQFEHFMRVFQELVAKTYTVQLGDYAGEKFKVLNARAENNLWVVGSQIEPSGRSIIRLDWILARSKSGLKVVDVRVDNLSMAITQRDEFSSILQQNNGQIDKLIDFMEQKIHKLDASV